MIDVHSSFDIVLSISKILAELGFSFWQILILVIAFAFRSEFKSLLAQVQNIKIAGSEISMRSGPSEKVDAVEKLKEVKSGLSTIYVEDQQDNSKLASAESMSEKSARDYGRHNLLELNQKLDRYLYETIVSSVARLKNNTSFLWPALKKSKTNQLRTAEIRLSTYNSIYDDLLLLKTEGLIDFAARSKRKFSGDNAVLYLDFEVLQERMLDFISTVEK